LRVVASASLIGSVWLGLEVDVNIQYKTVAKKVRLVVTQLPIDTDEHIMQAMKKTELRDIGYRFTKKSHWQS